MLASLGQIIIIYTKIRVVLEGTVVRTHATSAMLKQIKERSTDDK